MTIFKDIISESIKVANKNFFYGSLNITRLGRNFNPALTIKCKDLVLFTRESPNATDDDKLKPLFIDLFIEGLRYRYLEKQKEKELRDG